MNQTEIQALLPNVFQQTLDTESTENRENRENRDKSVLALIIDVMHILHADIEDQLTTVEDYFNPCRAPQDNFIDYLGRWTDLERLCNNSHVINRDCLQELIAQWRGTQKGLCKFLKIATGSNLISIKEGINKQGEEQSFHFLVQIPENQKHQLKLIQTIIEQEKPVYVSYEYDFLTE